MCKEGERRPSNVVLFDRGIEVPVTRAIVMGIMRGGKGENGIFAIGTRGLSDLIRLLGITFNQRFGLIFIERERGEWNKK